METKQLQNFMFFFARLPIARVLAFTCLTCRKVPCLFYCLGKTVEHGCINIQGTIALEFLEQVPDLDALVVAVGGGGFCSGIAVAAKYKKPSIKGLMCFV